MKLWSSASNRRVVIAATIAFAVGAATAATALRSRTMYEIDRRVENIRDEPNGEKIGTLLEGTEVRELERDGRWVRFRMEGWVWGPSLAGWTDEEEAAKAEVSVSGPAAERIDQRQPRSALQIKVPEIRELVDDRYGVFYSVSYDRDLRQVVLRFKVRDLSREALDERLRGAQADVAGLLEGELEFASVRVETNRPDGSGPVGAEIAITSIDHLGGPDEQSTALWRANTRRSSDSGETWSE